MALTGGAVFLELYSSESSDRNFLEATCSVSERVVSESDRREGKEGDERRKRMSALRMRIPVSRTARS